MENHMHAHMNFESFKDMGGTCMSCHYVDDQGNYLMWDEVKYGVFTGITPIDAGTVNVDVSWNQDEITPIDKMYTVSHAENSYGYDLVEQDDNIRENYRLKIYGDMDNPVEISIQEMIDRFGSETRVIANDCTAMGTGGTWIYQAEVTGIPLNKVLDSLGLHEDANMFDAMGVDGYYIPLYTEKAAAADALLVYEMNGEELTPEQGYPLAIWYGDGMAGGMFTRYLSELHIYHSDEEPTEYIHYFQGAYGPYRDPRTGDLINTPNIGVLTAETGQVFPAGEPVHLEGYAHAFDETVTKLEFSFDKGYTWVEVPTPDTENQKWVYWKMDVNDLTEPGAYLVKMRATSKGADGVEHTNAKLPAFLINIQ